MLFTWHVSVISWLCKEQGQGLCFYGHLVYIFDNILDIKRINKWYQANNLIKRNGNICTSETF